MAKVDENLFPKLVLVDGSAPSSPSAGNQKLFIDSADHLPKLKNSAGTVTAIGGGGAAGALVLLEQHTAASSATLDFTSCLSSTYDDYLIEIVNIQPATNGADLLMQLGTSAGPSWDTTAGDYYWMLTGKKNDGADSSAFGNPSPASGFKVPPVVGNGGSGVYASLHAGRLASTDGRKHFTGTMYYDAWISAAAWVVSAYWGGTWLNATVVTGLRFLFSSGDVASGTIRVYGIAK